MTTLCDSLCTHQSHPFLYPLSTEEKEIINNTCSEIVKIYEDADNTPQPSITKSLVRSKLESLSILYKSLITFFDSNQTGSFFIKLSSISPKDCRFSLLTLRYELN